MTRPLALAVTGGIGAGKSEALRAFARHGAPTISSDEVVHGLLREDGEVRGALLERFGARILDGEGRIDRAALAAIVFADRADLAFLEGVLHPRVQREVAEWRDALARRPDPPAVCVAEVPLLYEAGSESRFDAVVVVTAPPEVCRARGRAVADGRAARLIPDEEKIARADFVYVNDGSLEELDGFVAEVLARLPARG